MIKARAIGTTGLEVSELSFGTVPVAGLFKEVSEEEARATLQEAFASGVTYFDTAPFYGFGRGEQLTGEALRSRREGVVLSTKVGRLLSSYQGNEARREGWVNPLPFQASYDYSYDGIMRSFDASQRRLGLDRIDILYVHDIGRMVHGAEHDRIYWHQLSRDGYKALRELRDFGIVRAIGVAVNEWEILMDALSLGEWDVFLLAGRYTLLDQTALDPLLSRCLKAGTSVVAAAPFNGGALMGTGKWNYVDAPDHVVKRVSTIERFCLERSVPVGAAALQFALTHPAVCSVLTGPANRTELRSTLDWWQTPIYPSFWDDMVAAGLVSDEAPLPRAIRQA